MSITGYYYLHANDDLIYKPYNDGLVADFRESDLVRMFWPLDASDRYTAWRTLVEATAMGASKSRIKELADKWSCTDEDAKHFAACFGLNLYKDGNMWCATRAAHINIQESPTGFGPTCLEAIADLLDECGFKPSKTWGNTIKDVLQVEP